MDLGAASLQGMGMENEEGAKRGRERKGRTCTPVHRGNEKSAPCGREYTNRDPL